MRSTKAPLSVRRICTFPQTAAPLKVKSNSAKPCPNYFDVCIRRALWSTPKLLVFRRRKSISEAFSVADSPIDSDYNLIQVCSENKLFITDTKCLFQKYIDIDALRPQLYL